MSVAIWLRIRSTAALPALAVGRASHSAIASAGYHGYHLDGRDGSCDHRLQRHPPAYTGLGVQRSAFEAANTQAPPNPAAAPPGLAWYTVMGTDSGGRVTSSQMTENAQPAMDDRTRLGLVSGVLLPDDATETNLNTDTCIVWRSPKLKGLIGMEYAAATTTTGTTTADMRPETSPAC